MRSRLAAFRATGPGPVFTILPTIEDADTTCPKGTTSNSRNKPGLPGTPASSLGLADPRAAAGTITSLVQLNGIPAAEARASPRSVTAATEPSASPAPANHQPLLADTCAFADEQGRSFSALYSWAAWAAARRALELTEASGAWRSAVSSPRLPCGSIGRY